MSRVDIIGGSVAGLIAAEEIAKRSQGVTVYEEHREIGIPEKCDGLVSAHGINELGLVPPSSIVQNKLTRAVFFSPGKKEVMLDATRQNVVVLDRSRFDKFLAERAAKAGANIEVGRRVSSFSQTGEEVTLRFDDRSVSCEIMLDCSGYESYIRGGGQTFQAGQYLVYGKWFEKSTVEVYIDPMKAPGFFFWVIPISSDIAKIGVAGEGINTFSLLDSFSEVKGAVAIRKSAAPVICSGTIKSFVDRRVVRAGDSAGQPKPTTGGGIYTGGYAGMLAGRAACEALESGDLSRLENYETTWRATFADEFRIQLLARNAFSKLSSKQIDQLFDMINASDIPKKISEEGDFDRHSTAILKAFGLGNTLSALGMVLTNEIRALF